MKKLIQIASRYPLLAVIPFFIVWCLGITLIAASFQKEENYSHVLRLEIAQKYGKPELTLFDMTDITQFDWEEFCIFTRHTQYEEIEETLGFVWPELQKKNIDMNDDVTLLVFVDGSDVVEYYVFPKIYGDFDDSLNKQCVTPEDAVFEVQELPEHDLVVTKFGKEPNVSMNALKTINSLIQALWRGRSLLGN
ncbi:hypothetical protein KKH43_03325 [Patescibacteria group bacterium]|nr:hypothetical protein [Patescibacteria group bacterium]